MRDPTPLQYSSAVTDDQESRLIWGDVVRAVATTLVVSVHSASVFTPFASKIDDIGLLYWTPAAIFASVSRICVPLFFLLSGAFLLSRAADIFLFWRKRIIRLALPWLIWSCVFLLYRKYALGNRISVESMLLCIFTGETYYHLWFMYAIAGVYVAMPFFSHLSQPQNHQLLTTAAILYLLFAAALPAVSRLGHMMTGRDFSCGLSCAPFTNFPGMAILGFAISQIDQTAGRRKTAICILIFSTIMTIAMTIISSLQAGTGVETHFSYLDPFVLCSACSFFYLMMTERWPLSVQVLSSCISKYSLGIYFCHPLMIELLSALRVPGIPVIGGPVYAILTMLLTLLCCCVTEKIRILRKLVT